LEITENFHAWTIVFIVIKKMKTVRNCWTNCGETPESEEDGKTKRERVTNQCDRKFTAGLRLNFM
jgi:hypothetical protein